LKIKSGSNMLIHTHLLTNSLTYLLSDSNIWYTLSVIVDYRKLLSTQSLAVLSIELTLILMSPACYYIFVNGTRQSQSKGNGLTYGLIVLANCALSYFLASFQVHEKSLLLVLVPLSLLTLDNPWTMTWIQHIGTWTMFPLLIKDQLRIPYVIVSVLYSTLVRPTFTYLLTYSLTHLLTHSLIR
jgi:alpha-1,3-glucosyltransferase